jgi:uncharacterized repeat protein (TIGR01451 family)
MPRVVAIVLACALVATACAPAPGQTPNCTLPRIDPTGERLFTWGPDPNGRQVPGAQTRSNTSAVSICTKTVIAPVGAEVVVVAGVCGRDNYLMANQRIDWMLAPGGVGQFAALGSVLPTDYLFGATTPKKVDNTYAIGNTSSQRLTLNRGTPTKDDDVLVERGQAWATITSPLEGSSLVTAFAPGAYGWDRRQDTAVIHWIDADFALPPDGAQPAGGRQTLTTTVVRKTTRAPVPGWIVRYETTGSPPAGFLAPGLTTPAPVVEVETNALGQASVQMVQLQPGPGSNTVSIEVIRPSNPTTRHADRLVIGTGRTQVSWGSSQLAVTKTGPAMAAIGSTATYTIDVRNGGATTARSVVVTAPIAAGLQYVSSNPPADTASGALVWRLGDLAGGQARRIDVQYQVTQNGTITTCASVASADGDGGRACATTTVQTAAIELRIEGPRQLQAGQAAPFRFLVTNRTTQPTGALSLLVRYDPGLVHATGSATLQQDFASLPPGGTFEAPIDFVARNNGRLCVEVEVRAAPSGSTLTRQQACVDVYGDASQGTPGGVGPGPGAGGVPGAGPGAGGGFAGQPRLTVRHTGPETVTLKEPGRFTIEVRNEGNAPATQIEVLARYEPALAVRQAEDGFDRDLYQTTIDQTGVGDLLWRIPTLRAGERRLYTVEVQGEQVRQQACGTVLVTSAETSRQSQQACTRVVAAREGLNVAISDLSDTLRVGQETTYVVTVTNRRSEADNNVSVIVELPAEMQAVATGTTGPAIFTIPAPDFRQVRFAVLATLPAGQSATYRIRARAMRPVARGAARVEARSALEPDGVQATERTDVIP